ncbi:hypothetical protein [Burkholderia sp. Ac-20353]|uniref:hypothetical protein n=1 Tax=Burkholderia sp. Ac-20353 TaxID=2703894 RepID=UPI00197C8A70|nr:hypothetical protein [Burkholderia sp. Ac-20353]MBN3787227.1 hypothetical protein [Burkholderia sp. Ac-20353]
MQMSWGLLGPEILPAERRTRTLNLGASVRAFNELAVPGLGGLWFAKQLFLATLGVRAAEHARTGRVQVTNIEAGNAIEAIACWSGFRRNGHAPDARLRGFRKLNGQQDLTFARVRKPGFYVSQPMRMSIVQALPSLGLVDAGASRFNAFRCTQTGDALIDAQASGYEPCYYSQGVLDYLVQWMSRGERLTDNSKLAVALSPLEPMMPDALALVAQQLRMGGDADSRQARRRAALAWVNAVREAGDEERVLGWDQRPVAIDDAHWNDLRAGARFFRARDEALAVLDALESAIAANGSRPCFELGGDRIPDTVAARLDALKLAAQAFLDEGHGDIGANQFCRECIDPDDTKRVETLVLRDERVLRVKHRQVVPGPAFREGATGTPDPADPDEAAPTVRAGIVWPAGISYRIQNLFLLNADLHGELGHWLESRNPEADE